MRKKRAEHDWAGACPTRTAVGTVFDFDCEKMKKIIGGDIKGNHKIYKALKKTCGVCPSVSDDLQTDTFWNGPGDNCSLKECMKACDEFNGSYCDLIPNKKAKALCKISMSLGKAQCKGFCALECKKK